MESGNMFVCTRCGNKIERGALIFSPPDKETKPTAVAKVDKFHICLECWPELEKWINKSK